MPKGIYKRNKEFRQALRQRLLELHQTDPRVGFKEGNKPKNIFKKGNEYQFPKGNVPWNKGKKRPQDTAPISGDRHHNWKGGITRERVKIWWSEKYKGWRARVFRRDNYTCQECGARNGQGKNIALEAHHIKAFAQYPSLRFKLSNGITLCKPCHKKTPNYGVRKKR